MEVLTAGAGSEERRAISSTTVAGWGLALGSLGITATSVLYALSPRVAAMPVSPFDPAAAQAAATAGASTMLLAGAVGIAGDLLWATAGLMLARRAAAQSRPLGEAGWIAVAFGLLLFTVVDLIVGFVVPQLAAAGDPAFTGFKRFFDALFRLATLTTNVGLVVAFLSETRTTDTPVRRALSRVITAVCGIGALAAVAGFAGWPPADQVFGPLIGLTSVLTLVAGLQFARSAAVPRA
jgi:hypothetical protein